MIWVGVGGRPELVCIHVYTLVPSEFIATTNSNGHNFSEHNSRDYNSKKIHL